MQTLNNFCHGAKTSLYCLSRPSGRSWVSLNGPKTPTTLDYLLSWINTSYLLKQIWKRACHYIVQMKQAEFQDVSRFCELKKPTPTENIFLQFSYSPAEKILQVKSFWSSANSLKARTPVPSILWWKLGKPSSEEFSCMLLNMVSPPFPDKQTHTHLHSSRLSTCAHMHIHEHRQGQLKKIFFNLRGYIYLKTVQQ